jgi:hypothetical protein
LCLHQILPLSCRHFDLHAHLPQLPPTCALVRHQGPTFSCWRFYISACRVTFAYSRISCSREPNGGIRGSINPGLPHASFFSPGNQGFQRLLDGGPVSQPWMHAPPPHQAGPYPRNQLPAGFHPAIQPGGRMIPPQMPAPSNLSNFSAPQPFQLMPRPQQNPFVILLHQRQSQEPR